MLRLIQNLLLDWHFLIAKVSAPTKIIAIMGTPTIRAIEGFFPHSASKESVPFVISISPKSSHLSK